MLLANPVAFKIGNLSIYWYGIIITLAIIIAFGVVLLESRRRKYKIDFMMEVFLWAVPLAIVFARIAYVVFHASDFPLKSWSDLWAIISTRDGGISILGAIPGGALGVAIACKRNKINFAEVADMIAPGLILGQALGRWGNFVNQELYGELITNPKQQWFPFAVQIDEHFVVDEAGRVVDVLYDQWFQATFFYEMILNLIGFAILMVLSRKCKKNLAVFMAYLTWYCVVRSIMESIRTDAVSVGGVKIGVLGCALAAVGGFVVFLLIMLGVIKVGIPKYLQPEEETATEEEGTASETVDGEESVVATTEVEISSEQEEIAEGKEAKDSFREEVESVENVENNTEEEDISSDN